MLFRSRRIHNEAMTRGLSIVRVIWSDLERPLASKIGNGVLDHVLISNLLFQLEEPARVLAEAKRILKKGGTVTVIDWHDSFSGMGPHPDRVVHKQRGMELIAEAGFAELKEFFAGAHHWGFTALCAECVA